MRPGANVVSTGSLDRFRSDLARIASCLEEWSQSTEAERRRVSDELDRAIWQAFADVARATVQVGLAEADLAACRFCILPNGSRPDCSAQEAALAEAQQDLQRAQDRLAALQAAKHRLDAAAEPVCAGLRQLDGVLRDRLPQAKEFLRRKAEEVGRYAAKRPPETKRPAPARPKAPKSGGSNTTPSSGGKGRETAGAPQGPPASGPAAGNKPASDPGPTAAPSMPATAHGVQRLAGWTPQAIQAVKEGRTLPQADGARVYVREVAEGRFSFIVEGERGVITAHQNWRKADVDRIARNYGWKGWR